MAGIYIVYRNEEVLYIGKAQNLQQRWKGHHRLQQFKTLGADLRIAWLSLPQDRPGHIDNYERILIHALSPTLNGKHFPAHKSYAMKIGQDIKQQRISKGMTLQALARILGVSTTNMSRYEQGKVWLPFKFYAPLAKALDATVPKLFPWLYEVPSQAEKDKDELSESLTAGAEPSTSIHSQGD
jgi:transcriptional regulator with XRE-family HTH domain